MSARDIIDLQISVFRGQAADVDVPVLAKDPVDIIKVGDEILFCGEFDTESTIATLKDKTDKVDLERNGYIHVDTAPTSPAWRGFLFWNRAQGPSTRKLGALCLKVKLGTGTTALGDIAITDLEVGDTLLGVFHLTTAASVSTIDDITHLCTIASAAVLHCSFDTSNDQLWVFFHDANGGSAIDSPNLRFALVDGAAADTDIACADINSNAIAIADEILFCGHFSTKAAVATLEDKTSEAHATHTAGSIQLETTDTTSDLLFVIWHDVA